ncbi:Deoxyribose-phosphate aldolase [Paramyrothecium foliicola]|nr:Deoxyribose-phosphate aldolase [Paramyrothecium foliicola]
MSRPNTVTVTLSQVAKMIDHSLLHPTMTTADIIKGLCIFKKYGVATACVKPYLIPLALKKLEGIKVFEAEAAAESGGNEIDMVINIGKALGGDWDYVASEIRQINNAVEHHIAKLCQICSEIGVAFVKTSTGYGFSKQPDGKYSYKGATVPHLKLMRQHCNADIQIKAAGGVRTLDDLLHVMTLRVTRIGATATIEIMEEAARRGITDIPTTIEFRPIEDATSGNY